MRRMLMILIIINLFLSSASAQLENFTYKVTQSNASFEFWTTLPSERVFKDSEVPAETGSSIKIYAARNEFEPFQIIIKPVSSGPVTISMGDFGSGITAELYQVKYVNIAVVSDYLGRTGDYPDPLWPIENAQSISLTAGENTAIWFSIFIPADAASEDYSAVINISGINIPVSLHVFNKVRDDKGCWNRIEEYIGKHSEAKFSHGICPDCMIDLYPEYQIDLDSDE